MAAPVTPNAEKGRTALRRILMCMLVTCVGALAVAGGVVWGLVGLGALALGKGAGLLGAAGYIVAGGAGTAGASVFCMRQFARRGATHIQELAKEQQQAKLEAERKQIAAQQAEAEKKEQQRLQRIAQIEFNAQAATQLKKDVKPMRAIKIAPRPQQQQQTA